MSAVAARMRASFDVRNRRNRQRLTANAIGLVVLVVMIFPVYWMILTSFRRGVDIQSPHPSFVPLPGTLANYHKVFERDYFWTAVKNSFTVTLIVLVLALFIASRLRMKQSAPPR